jgi:hypothetical protein
LWKGIAETNVAIASAVALLVVIPEEPALSEVEWGTCFLSETQLKSTPETIDSIAFAVADIFLSPFSAQKTHVKSQNHLNPTNKTRSSWHFS